MSMSHYATMECYTCREDTLQKLEQRLAGDPIMLSCMDCETVRGLDLDDIPTSDLDALSLTDGELVSYRTDDGLMHVGRVSRILPNGHIQVDNCVWLERDMLMRRDVPGH